MVSPAVNSIHHHKRQIAYFMDELLTDSPDSCSVTQQLRDNIG